MRSQDGYRPYARIAVALFLTCASVLVPAAAHARQTRFIPPPATVGAEPAGLFTEIAITGIGSGTSTTGYMAPGSFDPLSGYPSTIPDGSTRHDAAFAGTIRIADPVTGRTGLSYCIDLGTDTETGVHYETGTWDEAHVPHLGYVEYILQHYFPTTSQPSGASSDATRAAAVQAALWYFTDNYVLDTTSPIRSLTEAIVADALANGPSKEPVVPTVTVTPSRLPAPESGETVGPFTVHADGPATIRSMGVEVLTDPKGTHPLPDGSTVQPGERLWARSITTTQPQGFVLDRVVTELEGTVYVYDGTNSGFTKAQTLILAQQADLVARGGATLIPFAAGRLRITKRIRGVAAGHQGRVVIKVACKNPDSTLDQHHTFTIPAGASPGRHTHLFTGLAAGSTCTITEPDTGATDGVTLVTKPGIRPEHIEVTAGEARHVTITDTYRRIRPVPVTG